MGSNVKLYRVNEVAHNLGLSKKSFLFPAGVIRMSVVGGSGFTLIELVMVIVISAVIAAVAIPWPQSFGIVKL
jgi:prepilin-type N-terminal cleavage/methylation domain-containing protein